MLGHLEDQARGGHRVARGNVAYHLAQLRVEQLGIRQIHCGVQVRLAGRAGTLGLFALQAGEHLRGIVEHPVPDLADIAGLLQDRQEVRRRDAAEFGRDPAQQEFVADDLAVDQAELRLQVQAELPTRQRMPQLSCQPRMLADGIVCIRGNPGRACRGGGGVHGRALLAAVLHMEEGAVGLFDQAGGVGRGTIEHGHADAARAHQFVARGDERPRERGRDAAGQIMDGLRRRKRGRRDRKGFRPDPPDHGRGAIHGLGAQRLQA